jgi:Phytanoyl-CoA dioxygenase (PhyH)
MLSALAARLTRRRPAPRIDVLKPDVPIDPATLAAMRREEFPDAGPVPWLDRPDALEAVEAAHRDGALTAEQAALARDFSAGGVVVLERFFELERLDAVWQAYEAALRDGRVTVPAEPVDETDRYPGRALNAHRAVPEIRAMQRDPKLVAVIELLLGVRVQPFQTIIGHKGSQQRAHSDSIHMTTYPLGYLAAAWIALEDIADGSGPLIYYPRSHRLPYVFSHDVGIAADDFSTTGYVKYHERYEPAVGELVARNALAERSFLARAGDVLVWHANLLHGGAPRTDLELTRKALVCHYFAQGALCYHDLASAQASFAE